MTYLKAALIGAGGGLTISGFWLLEDTYPLIAKGVVLLFSIVFISWFVKLK